MTLQSSSNRRCRVSTHVLPASNDHGAFLERIRADCPLSGQERTGVECSQCERFLAFHLSETAQPTVVCQLPCAACGGRAAGAVETAQVVFCEDCLEPISGSDPELGGG